VRETTVDDGSREIPIVVAEGAIERMRGLLGSSERRGLLLPRTRSVHTFGMHRPIDAVLLDRELRVIGVVRLAPRRVLLPRRRVRHILEVDRSPFTAGDRLRIR
jgi:uncharacterized membrane protein (UPF0127 family)